MKPNFRKTLESYGAAAKDEMAIQAEQSEREDEAETVEATERIETVVDWLAEKRAAASATRKETQLEIYEIQKEKQGVMRELKEDLAALDSPASKEQQEVSKDARKVVRKNGAFVWMQENKKDIPLRLGEMVTDLAWGIEYHLDPETVPRTVRKRLIVERAKHQLEDLLDRQIYAEEIASGHTSEQRKLAYQASRADRESGRLPFGILAERILVQFMRKLVIDGKLPYKIAATDVHQDVSQKIDFIIRKTDHHRGVEVEEDETLADKGIQFTLNPNPEVLARKKKQIRTSLSELTDDDRIDDIMLVQMQGRIFGAAYDRWRAQNRPPGGPDKFLDKDTKKYVFMNLARGMADDEELAQQWNERKG